MADRRATVTWEGTLTRGKGTVDTGSGALSGAPVTFASRMERSDGKTSPEELLAAAQAECFAMVLANMFSEAGNTPNRLEVTAVCTVVPEGAGIKITTMAIEAWGDVPGVDAQAFEKVTQDAEGACPVTNALRGNVEITVTTRAAQTAG